MFNNRTLSLEDMKDLNKFKFIFDNMGRDPEDIGKIWKFEDLLATPNAASIMPKVVSTSIMEAIEPLLIASRLLTRINYEGSHRLEFPAMGGFEVFELGETDEIPEVNVGKSGDAIVANISRFGVAFKLSKWMAQNSQWDVMRSFLANAGKAFARRKETQFFNMLGAGATVAFNNLGSSNSIHGRTTGRSLNGAGNGTITMDDIFDAMAIVMQNGFMPDTLIMHPLTWVMFVKDPVLRAFALQAGGGSFFASWQGSVQQQSWSQALLGGRAGSAGQNIVPPNQAGVTPSTISEYHPQQNSAPMLPNYFGFPVRIIVSPWVRMDPANMLTDIHVVDSSDLGALVVGQDVEVLEWMDPSTKINKISMDEWYGLAQFHEGQNSCIIKNVKVNASNQVVLPPQATMSASATFQEIGATDTVIS